MDQEELKRRTKLFALAVIQMVEGFPPTRTADIVGRQLVKAATSVGANYRAGCRARSLRDFVSKIAIVEEEADESVYWIELAIESRLTKNEAGDPLLREANEHEGRQTGIEQPH